MLNKVSCQIKYSQILITYVASHMLLVFVNTLFNMILCLAYNLYNLKKKHKKTPMERVFKFSKSSTPPWRQ